MEWSIYDARGRRKYLVPKERWAFLEAALSVGGEVATFCAVLAFSGARISEVLHLTFERIDCTNGTINLETLKRRRRGLIRSVPVPRRLFDLLDTVHDFKSAQRDPLRAGQRTWTYSRTTAWRRVKKVMHLAGIPEHLATPRVLRHSFATGALISRVDATIIQRWMGHAKLETTKRYMQAAGAQERHLVRLTWTSAPQGYRH